MSLYVPLLIQLELKSGAKRIDFEEGSTPGTEQSPSITENTRRRLMSGMSVRRSPPNAAKDSGAPLAPGITTTRNTATAERAPFRGRRTYSEVVVESIDVDRMTQCSEASSSNRTKAMSEGPWDIESLKYYFGNPGIEKTEGILHFYKYSQDRLAEEAGCRMLCMLGVPAHVAASDLVSFLSSHLTTIERLKIVRDSTPNQYFVIIKFKKHKDAVEFFEEFNGVLFNSLEPERCSLLFVDKIECVGEEEPTEGLQEMPTCAVCLERMDDSILSVLCNHTFHATCLQKWKDTVCPVCRYLQTPEMVAEQRCSDCGQSTDLWACLICGNVGCGRYEEGHAHRHYVQTSHTFCLRIGGVQVWDYAGDNYVHRLIQTDTEGKFVEYSRGLGDSENGEKDEKMDSLKMEYTCLLSSQLESQRRYFESRIADVEQAMKNMEKTSQSQMEVLEKEINSQSSEVKRLKEELSNVNSAKQVAEKKQVHNVQKLTKVATELEEERSMNNLLRNDQQKWKEKLDQVSEQKITMEKLYTTKIKELQEQINDLMLHFEAQSKLQEQIEKGTIAADEVTSVGVSTPETKQRRRSHKK